MLLSFFDSVLASISSRFSPRPAKAVTESRLNEVFKSKQYVMLQELKYIQGQYKTGNVRGLS